MNNAADRAAAPPHDDVPEADWAEQQVVAQQDPDSTPTVSFRHPSTAEADTADLAEQDLEVVLDDEES